MLVLGKEMKELEKEEWPPMFSLESEVLRVWMSKDYLAVLYRQLANGEKRLTVNCLRKKNGKDYKDGITWDELQRIKNECVGSEVWCIENYPAESACINVMNQRHLFLLDKPPKERFPEERIFNFG